MKRQKLNTIAIDNPLTPFADCIDSIPLKIGAPSFVFAAGYAENVELLGSVFDEIQLLILEPFENSPLGKNELAALERLKNDRLTYSVHLPVPSGIAQKNERGIKSVINIIKTFMPLGVESFILHVENSAENSETGLAAKRINEILETTSLEPETLCVENLHRGFDEVWEQVEGSGVSICFDVGHLLYMGGDPIEFIDIYGDRIRMAHIHGADAKDHRPLNAMPGGMLEKTLQKFIEIKMPGAVIIENYSVDEMRYSLACLCNVADKLSKS